MSNKLIDHLQDDDDEEGMTYLAMTIIMVTIAFATILVAVLILEILDRGDKKKKDD
jgi:hypothetical protein